METNLVTIKVVNNVAFIKGVDQATLLQAAKLVPSALELKDEDKNTVFVVKAGSAGHGSINENGAIFGAPAADGKACIQVQIPENIKADKRMEYVQDTYGNAILNLNDTLGQIADAVAYRKDAVDGIFTGAEVE
jgi:hypothetical protein